MLFFERDRFLYFNLFGQFFLIKIFTNQRQTFKQLEAKDIFNRKEFMKVEYYEKAKEDRSITPKNIQK